MTELFTQYLLLTATVTPNTLVNVSLVDPRIRLEHYRIAVAEWARIAEDVNAGLVIVETSGCSRSDFLGELDDTLGAQMSYLNYSPSQASAARGKGFLEWGAIRTALEFSELTATDTLYKVTGRLRVTNPRRVFEPLHGRQVRLRMRIDGSLADTRVVGATAEVWKDVLLPASDDVNLNVGIDIEQAVGAHVARALIVKQVAVSQFPQRPLFLGESGFNGTKSVPWRTAAKGYALRPFERIVSLAAHSLAH